MKEVIVISYLHRHGQDLTVLEGGSEPEGIIAEMILGWLHEIEDHAKRGAIRSLIAEGDFMAARNLYNEISGENFSWETLPVFTAATCKSIAEDSKTQAVFEEGQEEK